MAEVKLEDIKPNSYKSKEQSVKKEAPKATPVVSKSAVVSTKKPLTQKFKDAFIAEDVADIKSWFVEDILIPGAKNTVLDMLSMMFFGNRSSGRNTSYNFSRRGSQSYGGASYASYYNSQRGSERPANPTRSYHNSKIDYRDIVLERRDDAQKVVDEMRFRIGEYGQVSIAEMLDFMEITSNFNDNNWGWTRPNDIGIRRLNNGWLIDVAEAEPLEN